MTELAFLVELLLGHKLPKTARDVISARLRELAAMTPMPMQVPRPASVNPTGVQQAASTLANLAKHGDLMPIAVPPPEPVVAVAQTPATAAALASRNQAISEAISGKIEKGQTRPRKF
jgi:hypothetical protein